MHLTHWLHSVILLVVALPLCQPSPKVSSQLHLLTYEPLKFNLTFSSPIKLPKFQLLFNQINIGYNVLGFNEQASNSSYYLLEASLDGIIDGDQLKTQKYKLLFTEPLRVADGKLDLNSFVLRAQDKFVTQFNYIDQQNYFSYNLQQYTSNLNNLSISIITLVYTLAFFTVIGIHAYNFISIFVFISIQSPLFTTLDYRCAFYLLFQLDQVTDKRIKQIVYLCIPHFFIVISFVIGIAVRYGAAKIKDKSFVLKEIYYYFSYRFFIISWDIMCMPILVNVTHILRHRVLISQIGPYFMYPYLYISILLILLYSYMAYMTVNPQIKQPVGSWQSYTESAHFKLFYGFHLDIDAKNWKKRNFTFLVSLFRNAIIIFVCFGLVNVPNLLIQIFYLIYLFTLRPFKYNFFNHCIIGIQVFAIFFYLFRYLVVLYMWIGEEVITNTDFSRILTTNVVWLCVIVFTYVVLGIYELWRRIRQFRTQIAQSKRRNSKEKLQYEMLTLNSTRQTSNTPHTPKSSKVKQLNSVSLNNSQLLQSLQLTQSQSIPRLQPQSPSSSQRREKQKGKGKINSVSKGKNTKSTPLLLKDAMDYSQGMVGQRQEENANKLEKQRSRSRQRVNRSIKKNKQKSSLLQSISMGQEIR